MMISDSALETFARERNLEVMRIGGQCVFPVYARSGGLAASGIAYLLQNGCKWPPLGDLGRASKQAHSEVFAVEFEYSWSSDECLSHLVRVWHA